jgi:hypothetical protein
MVTLFPKPPRFNPRHVLGYHQSRYSRDRNVVDDPASVVLVRLSLPATAAAGLTAADTLAGSMAATMAAACAVKNSQTASGGASVI